MPETLNERILTGVPVSGGSVLGVCHRLADKRFTRVKGNPGEEAVALRNAISRAGKELEELSAGLDRLAAEILEFQQVLLEDDDLLEPVFSRIDSGESADGAWAAVFAGEIAEYQAADDEYMAARAADLGDLRDRVLRALSAPQSAGDTPPDGAIVVAGDLTPSAFLELDWTRLSGAALGAGSATSHVSILARARGVTMVVGLGELDETPSGATLALDGRTGTMIVAPSSETRARFQERIAQEAGLKAQEAEIARKPAITRAGRKIRVLVNVDDPSILDTLDPDICDGIGLTRTEFLFSEGPPDEETQLQAYETIVRWANGRPVTIRTLDAGGDKPVPGVTLDGEQNPFLGVRGLRLSLLDRSLFRVQLRAIARAARLGPVKLMVPMVTAPFELEEAREELDLAIAELSKEGLAHARPECGIMIETPAAALTAADWDADFYSIGSNDLIQYVTACARDNPNLAKLADPCNPAVLELIGRTVAAGKARGVEVSLCGDMASSPELVPLLLSLGLECFSVAPAQVGPVKLAISSTEGDMANGE
ncbi:phosphoenolpyruvate--protein phosphotransferase [Rhizobiales bacterium]|uniref:phosphoenolpyruvate--protein phosphotransferase n=1 Tax=Hongsoonwoonella zoysiae TaxID=2821844 RepID=UPI00155FFC04|nr:phosphoenolpyruvate--protein phosphotransferase [Hongsoonwoonella zoysiae]NRG19000.1 phosphoenolpyruvate--protein phosphotransferase [Hongsoonwoonella zoysiae]